MPGTSTGTKRGPESDVNNFKNYKQLKQVDVTYTDGWIKYMNNDYNNLIFIQSLLDRTINVEPRNIYVKD